MDIRRAKADDLSGIAEIEAEVFSDPWSEQALQPYVCSEGGMCYTASVDGKVIAYVIGRVIAPEGEIYRIATHPAYRRRGIAYRLLDYAVKCEKGRGLEVLFLEVRASNTAAKNLYKSYGFKDMGVRKNYYKDPVEDAVLMVRASKADFPI